jgi:hypothetical protein
MDEKKPWQHKEWRPITFDKDWNPTLWWYVLALPAIIILCTLHFLICSVLTIFVHPPRKRYRFYEYYARWGWGNRPGMQDWHDEGEPYPGGKKPGS